MSANTNIEWTDHTFNPWEGCQKAGPGCDNCYAETRNKRFGGGVAVNWGPGAPRRRTSVANWRKPIEWNKAHEAFFAEHGRRQRVFCASLADVFDNAVDPQWRIDLRDLIEATPSLDWLLLTKRIGNALDMLPVRWATRRLPPNIWMGATIVNQTERDRDLAKLLAVPASVHFLSVEPLLAPLTLNFPVGHLGKSQINWVIVGGESGPGARPMHPAWARNLRDECAAAGVPFLFKQWGEWTPGENVQRQRGTVDTAFLCGDGWHIHPLNLATDEGHIDDEPDLYRVGKKAAGRFLDGVQHDGYPA